MKKLVNIIIYSLILIFLFTNSCLATENIQEPIQKENPITDFMIICMAIYFVGLPIVLFCLKRNS